MSGVEAARALLPWWALWGPFTLTPLLAFFAAYLFTRFALGLLARPFYRAADQPWYERARAAYPAVKAAQLLYFTVPAAAGVAALPQFGFLAAGPDWLYLTLVTLAAYLGASWAVYRTLAPMRGVPLVSGDWLRLHILRLHLLGLLLALLVAYLLPPRFDSTFFAVVVPTVVVVLFLMIGGGLWLGVRLGATRPVPESLKALVARVAAAHGVRPPRIAILNLPSANAGALPFFGWITFLRELPEVLSEPELEAVTAHELAHLRESRLMLLGRMLPILILIPLLLAIKPLVAVFGWLVAVVMPLAALVVAFASRLLSRVLERRADAAGKQTETQPGLYARALETLHRVNLAPAVESSRGTTHPNLYDRMIAAGVTPDYPRPRPPGGARAILLLAVMGIVVGVGGLLGRGTWEMQGESAVRTALFGTTHVDLGRRALAAWDTDLATSAVLFRAAGEMGPVYVAYPANEAIALAALGRCDEARRALAEAQRRQRDRPDAEAVRQASEQVALRCRAP
jgi:Zn-dependent protease with chaperone function